MNKVCRKCEKEKPLEEFRDNKKTKDKKFPWCISCQDIINRELYLRNKEKRLKQINKWNIDHNEKTKKYKQDWAAKNKETPPPS